MAIIKKKPSEWSAATIAAIKSILGWSTKEDAGTAASAVSGHESTYDHSKIATALQPDDLADVATSGSYNDLSTKPTIPDELSDLAEDATHRTVTDAEKSTWNAKQDALVADTDYLTPGTALTTYEPIKGEDDNYVTDAEKTVIGNTSGTNTGDQVLPTRDSLGLDTDDTVTFANLSGTNTGDQDLSGKEDVGVAAGLVGTHESTYNHGNIHAPGSDAETASSIAAINHGATEKEGLVDADEITGQDSENSFSLIRTKWTNVKAFLKTYFDTLYATISSLGKVIGINDQTGVAYTLVLADAGKYVRCTNAAAIAITVPLNATVAYDIGTVITIAQGGTGQVTVAGDVGVTVNGYLSQLSTAGQFTAIQLLKTSADEWTLIGGAANE